MEVNDRCPVCGSFNMRSHKFDKGYSKGEVERCLDCGWDSTISAESKEE